LSDIEKGQIVGGSLAGLSATKSDTLLGIWRVAFSKVMWACTNLGKTTSAKRNSGRKSAPTERDRSSYMRRTFSKNHRTTTA
jgi:hypothetical protein